MIVIDCAPTGETIRMLAVPEILNFYFTRIFPIQRTVLRSVRPVAQRHDRHAHPERRRVRRGADALRRWRAWARCCRTRSSSSIRIVLNPERMVINESQRLYTYLSLFGFPVDAWSPTACCPEEARSPYFDRWFDIQAGHLADGARGLRPPALLRGAPLRPRDGRASTLLDEFGRDVFGDEDPTAVLFQERPVEVKKEGERLRALHPAALRGEGQDPGLRPRARSSWSRWTTSAATSCCRGRSPRGGCMGAAFADQRLRVGFGEKEEDGASGERPRKACCLVSEILEEAGLDREKARRLRRQVLEGMILLCQWQLERMEAADPPARGGRRAREGEGRVTSGTNAKLRPRLAGEKGRSEHPDSMGPVRACQRDLKF